MTAFAPIDLTGYKPATFRDQPGPILIWAEVADLVIDRTYQRNVTTNGKRAIQRIADDFDWTRFEPILVAPIEDGKLAVVDGQHRAHAAALAGLTKIPAMSVPMTRIQQARGFAAINRDRIRLSSWQIYRAELAAGTGWATTCRDAVEAAGCTLATSNPTATQKKPGVIYAVGLIRRMIEAGEAEAVTVGLAAIRESQAGADEGDVYNLPAWSGATLAVWLPAIASNQRFMRLDLATTFDAIDFEALADRCKVLSRAQGVPARRLAQEEVVEALRSAMQEAAA
ncbi:ParB/RepB/Spo0J family partition protein [Roseibacterium sp. SDUM158017]|uniref:ParB/RepB/Spo0J family partition protein n=1 Tax=Roseicyclus salinarum TaxID=3036773 RepID=UPI00241516E6|nr:ParB/RepB/Spo0J family partition protein [Roseibacterium sp. SDUM158017]MDG4650081.1 ParB/RepB/Spo0J family partition protein [Roseibacterium sp. SDUM158017]